MNGDFMYCQSEIEGGERCETQCNHCKSYYAPLENNYRYFLPNDIARCNRDDCPLHLECARWLDRLPMDDYWYNHFEPKGCENFIEKKQEQKNKKK